MPWPSRTEPLQRRGAPRITERPMKRLIGVGVNPHLHLLLTAIAPHAVRNRLDADGLARGGSGRPVELVLPTARIRQSTLACDHGHTPEQSRLEACFELGTARKCDPIQVSL